jgi:hypothetical protein
LTNQSNSLPRPDNRHILGYSLMKTLEEFVRFPIKTEKWSQPRFLLVAIDVKTGMLLLLIAPKKEGIPTML